METRVLMNAYGIFDLLIGLQAITGEQAKEIHYCYNTGSGSELRWVL